METLTIIPFCSPSAFYLNLLLRNLAKTQKLILYK